MYRLLVACLALALSSDALAFGEDVHELLTVHALAQAKPLDARAEPIAPGLPAAIRTAIDARARVHPNPKIREAWTTRYPEPASFDPWAYKEFLLLAPDREVIGIDTVTFEAATLRELVGKGSRQPDEDFRNRDRLAYDADRKPILDSAGQQVPADPALLNMGRLGALSSQAHAHYGLADVEFSDDPEVLKTDPVRFAVPSAFPEGPVLTLAPEMAQLHTDLALLAMLVDLPSQPEDSAEVPDEEPDAPAAKPNAAPGAASLTWMHAGQALHYLEDVGNPIHTVQVGLYAFFVDAFTTRMVMAVKTGGGYLGELRSLASIGIDILTNHHTISEDFTAKRAMVADKGDGTPEAEALLVAMRTPNQEMVKKIIETIGPPDAATHAEFGKKLTEVLIDASSAYGDDVYAATRAIAQPDYRSEGVLFDYTSTDPETAVVAESPDNAEEFATFWKLQQEAFGRSGTTVRAYAALTLAFIERAMHSEETRTSARDQVIDRLVVRQLAMLDEAEARRAVWMKRPPESAAAPEREPAVLAVEIVLTLGLIAIAAALVRRRRPRKA